MLKMIPALSSAADSYARKQSSLTAKVLNRTVAEFCRRNALPAPSLDLLVLVREIALTESTLAERVRFVAYMLGAQEPAPKARVAVTAPLSRRCAGPVQEGRPRDAHNGRFVKQTGRHLASV